jgi:chromosome segregation ATPase
MTEQAHGASQNVDAGAHGANAGKSEQGQQVPPVDVAELHGKLTTLMDENKKYRDKLKELSAVADDRAKKAGEYEPLLKQREEELAAIRAELESVKPLATAEQERRAKREAAIAEEAKALDAEEQADLALITDIDARERMLKRLQATKQPKTQEQKKAAPKGVDLTAGKEPTLARQPFTPFPASKK